MDKIKALQDYLGPRLGYDSNEWPTNQVDHWLLEYLILLKEQHYLAKKKENDAKKVEILRLRKNRRSRS